MDQYLAYQNQLAQLNEGQNAIASQKSEAIRELEQTTGLSNVANLPKKKNEKTILINSKLFISHPKLHSGSKLPFSIGCFDWGWGYIES
jgi:hypothetical protein